MHAKEAYKGSGLTALLIRNLDTRCAGVASLKPRSHYPRQRAPVILG